MAKYKVGDTVKDTNPRCTHYGAVGKVVKIDGGKTTFVVTNRGEKYNEGDKLTKTNWQLEKNSEDKKSPYVPIKALPDGKPMIVHSPMDSVMYKVLSDTTAIKQRAAVLDSIRTGKLDPKVYNERIKKQRLKKEGEMTEQVKEAFIGMATNKVMSLKKLEKAQKVLQGSGSKLEKGKSIDLAKQILKAKKDGDKLKVQKLQQKFTKNAGVGAAIAIGGTALWAGAKVLGKIFKKKPGQIVNRVKAKEFRNIGKRMGRPGTHMATGPNRVGVNIPKVASSIMAADSSQDHMYPESARMGKLQGGLTGALLGAPGANLAAGTDTKFMRKLPKGKLRSLVTVLGGIAGGMGGAAFGQRIAGGPRLDKTAGMTKMKSLVDTGLSVEDAAKAAYPNATPEALNTYVSKYKANKKKGKMYVDKVVLKKANLLQRAATKLNFSKIANATLGYRGQLPTGAGINSYGGGSKLPNQVGSVLPGNRGMHV